MSEQETTWSEAVRALTLQGSKFAIEELPVPEPRSGQLLVRPLFNGICGSDLHMREEMGKQEAKADGDRALLPKIVLGHEFSAEIVAIGAGTETDLMVGDRIVALPFTPGATPSSPISVGLSPKHPGGLASVMLVDADRSFRIPDAVPDDLAALTEPLSVGRHAVNLADRYLGPNIIIGCGPIGLAVLLALKDQGRGPILATDLSEQRRRTALELGADIVIDPVAENPYDLRHLQFTPDGPSPLLRRDFAGRPAGLNIFECTGAAAVLQQITREAPRHSHVIYTGVCMHAVDFMPVLATVRELTIEYSFAYTPRDFRESIDMIVRKPELVARLVTSRVPLEDAEQAFDRLQGTPSEIKVLIDVRA